MKALAETELRCRCGSVELNLVGEPIIRLACHCADCHEGSRQLEALSQDGPLLDVHGGTPFALYRRDRFNVKSGHEFLARLKVDEDSPERVYSSCCQSALFMDLDKKLHWVPVYQRGTSPSIEMRINTKGLDPGDVPSSSGLAPRFVWRLITAQIGMLLRR